MKLINKNNILPFFIFTTLLCLPLYIVRCSSFAFCSSPVPFTLLEILILITIFTWLIEKHQKKRNIRKLIKDIRSKIPIFLQIIILFFLIFSGINIIFSPNLFSALGYYKAYFVEPALFFLVIFDYLTETKNFKLIYWGILLNGLWVGLLTIGEKIVGISPFNQGEFLSRGRVGAIYSTSNSVGLLIGPLIIIGVSYFLNLIKEKDKTLFLGFKEVYWIFVAIVVLCFGLLASGSRGAILGVLASLIFFAGFILSKKIQQKIVKNNIKKIFIGLVILFFAVNIGFLFNVNYIITSLSKTSFYSQISPRLCLWQSAVNIVKEKPLTGSGLGGFALENNTHHTCSQEKLNYPHNILLNFWSEIGIFGLISFIALSSWFFYVLLHGEKINYLKLGIASFLVSVLIHGLVDVPYFKNDLSVQYWSVLALGLFLISRDDLVRVVVRRLEQLGRR